MYNIAQKLTEVAAVQPNKIGLIEVKSNRTYSYEELETLSNKYASYFHSQGIEPGQRVMLMVSPSVDFICLTFALFRLGAPVILIDPGMGYRNLLRCV